MHSISLPCSMTVKDSFRRQVAIRAAQRGRWLSVADALREALAGAGYDLTEEPDGGLSKQAPDLSPKP